MGVARAKLTLPRLVRQRASDNVGAVGVLRVSEGSEVAAEEVVAAVCVVVPEPVAVATEVVRPNGALGGVLAIRADGFCCYYCASAIGSLTLNSEALSSDWAPCSSTELEAVRAQILRT